MTRLFIATKTVTHAMRCRDILRQKGFSAQVEKRTSLVQNGCGYGVTVRADKEEVFKILMKNDVKVLRIYEI